VPNFIDVNTSSLNAKSELAAYTATAKKLAVKIYSYIYIYINIYIIIYVYIRQKTPRGQPSHPLSRRNEIRNREITYKFIIYIYI